MWETVKQYAKKVNEWYDTQGEVSRFWPSVAAVAVSLMLVTSHNVLVAILGWAYFGCLAAARWMYLNGKL